MCPCGSGASSGKALGCGLDGSGSIPGVEGGGYFSSHLLVQTGPGVHSTSYIMTSYKMSTLTMCPGFSTSEGGHPSVTP